MSQTDSHSGRPSNRETENEDLKPAGEGKPPRPASEPAGSEGSSRNDETRSDPATGENPEDPGPKSLRDTPKVG